MKRFFDDQRGFVLLLSLIALPVFIGFALIIIDIGRGNNIHADLQTAADAVALAGAGELDGGVDNPDTTTIDESAIARAKRAMAEVTNTVNMLNPAGGGSENLVYEDASGNEFRVIFLEKIPASDLQPINQAWVDDYATTDSTLAHYVYVRAQSGDLLTAFFNPATRSRVSVPIAAEAVAKTVSAACNIPPLYFCNPFEYDAAGNYVGSQLQERFAAGDLYGRMIRLHPKGSSTESAGNFGFLSVDGTSSADSIRDFFAGAVVPKCFSSDTVQTKPGAATSISQGINTRFDIYEGPFNNWNNDTKDFPIAPAMNVRKGIKVTGNDCVSTNTNVVSDDHIYSFDLDAAGEYKGFVTDASGRLVGQDEEYGAAFGFPDNDDMSPAGVAVPGADLGSENWPLKTYLTENYGAIYSEAEIDDLIDYSDEDGIPSTMTVSDDDGNRIISRYDVYQWEISEAIYSTRNPGEDLIEGTADDSESGSAMCGPAKVKPINAISEPDRRVLAVAIIDCGEGADEGGGVNSYKVNSYASVFMTRPMVSYNPSVDPTIDIEIIDITGYGGNGTLETYIRREAILVR